MTLDGSPAAATTIRGTRAVFNNALRYAVEVKLPRPPEPIELAARAPLSGALHAVGTGLTLWRIHYTLGEHVLAWNQPRRSGPARGRFDPHHLPPPWTRPAASSTPATRSL